MYQSPRIDRDRQKAEGVRGRDSKQIHIPRHMHLALRSAAAMHARSTGELITLASLVEQIWERMKSEADRRDVTPEEMLVQFVFTTGGGSARRRVLM